MIKTMIYKLNIITSKQGIVNNVLSLSSNSDVITFKIILLK